MGFSFALVGVKKVLYKSARGCRIIITRGDVDDIHAGRSVETKASTRCESSRCAIRNRDLWRHRNAMYPGLVGVGDTRIK